MQHHCVLRSALALSLALGLLCVSSAAHAITFTIGYSDSGWYDDTGAHTFTNENYAAGYDGFGELRNFFTFNLNTIPTTQSVLSATLRIYSPADGEPNVSFTGGYQSGDPFETYEVHEVTTPAVVVTAGGAGLTAIYNDLGTGTVFGSTSVSLADNGTMVEVALNAAAFAAIESNAALDPGDFVLGGLMTTYSGQTSAEEAIFAHTDPPNQPPYLRELVIVMTPEPGTGLLMAFGMLTLGAGRARRCRARG